MASNLSTTSNCTHKLDDDACRWCKYTQALTHGGFTYPSSHSPDPIFFQQHLTSKTMMRVVPSATRALAFASSRPSPIVANRYAVSALRMMSSAAPSVKVSGLIRIITNAVVVG